MAVGYRAVQWNSAKRWIDLGLVLFVFVAVGGYIVATGMTHPRIPGGPLIYRGTAIAAFALLSINLAIGPLARMDRRFAPLLYNRRHLGVVMFSLASVHALLTTMQFHAFGDANPLVSIFAAYRMEYDPFAQQTGNISRFPFEPLGAIALGILFLMAATSHDFWLRNLGAGWWKRLHLLVLVAYGLVVLHVALGVLQSERSPVFAGLLLATSTTVFGLHAAASWRERRADRDTAAEDGHEWIAACAMSDLEEGRAHTVTVDGQRRAVWLHDGDVHATGSVCRHQGGPLAEGRIIDGCITCPWHGWQYRPEDGQSPPPFDERIPTYPTRIEDGQVYIAKDAAAPGEEASHG
jgi:sulfoxide reductase heme-binding subunit YedZ